MNENYEIGTECESSPRVMAKRDAFVYFLRIGLALCALRVINTGVQQLAQELIYKISPELYASLIAGPWFMWAISIIPLYFFAFPAFFLILPNPLEKYKAGKMSFPNVLGSVVSCTPVMYIGNIIGIAVVGLLSLLLGHNVQNGLVNILNQSPLWLSVLCVVIIAPIGEEFIFRKLLCDRLAPFGEARAVIFAGLAFGLFHGNFNQFFYTAMVGMLLAYVYIRKKNIIYPIIMHMCLNLFGGIIPQLALSGEVMSLLEKLETDPSALVPEDLLALIPAFIFLFLMGSLFVAGLAVLIFKGIRLLMRKTKFPPRLIEIENTKNSSAFWSNPGIIASMVIMGATFILSLM